jgi:multidrug transporter EmrE-like cation transporter
VTMLRRLGWALAIVGGLTFLYVTAMLLVSYVLFDQPTEFLLTGLDLIGLLALIAGILILRTHPKDMPSN